MGPWVRIWEPVGLGTILFIAFVGFIAFLVLGPDSDKSSREHQVQFHLSNQGREAFIQKTRRPAPPKKFLLTYTGIGHVRLGMKPNEVESFFGAPSSQELSGEFDSVAYEPYGQVSICYHRPSPNAQPRVWSFSVSSINWKDKNGFGPHVPFDTIYTAYEGRRATAKEFVVKAPDYASEVGLRFFTSPGEGERGTGEVRGGHAWMC